MRGRGGGSEELRFRFQEFQGERREEEKRIVAGKAYGAVTTGMEIGEESGMEMRSLKRNMGTVATGVDKVESLPRLGMRSYQLGV